MTDTSIPTNDLLALITAHPASAVLPNLDAVTALDKALLSEGSSVTALGYHVPGDGGGGTFHWDATSAVRPITGMIFPARSGGSGRWFRVLEGEINDRMCGAAIDGVAYDDAALTALAAYVAYNPHARIIRFLPGIRKVLPSGGADRTPFALSGIDGVTIHWDGTVFNCGRSTGEVSVTVFRFGNCRSFRGVGRAVVNGTLIKADIVGNSSAKGSIFAVFENDCSAVEIDVEANGMLEPVLFTRTPSVMLDASIPPFIGAGGSGYAVGDILTLRDIGSAATVSAALKVSSIGAGGAVSGLSVVKPGLFPVFFDGKIPGSTKGFKVAGGRGAGCLVCPYTIDASDSSPTKTARGGSVRVKARTCFYGYNGQWNLSDADIFIDADIVYRGYFGVGVTNNRVTMRVRNQHLNSVAACAMGIMLTASLAITVLPATIPGFCTAGTILVAGFYGANSGRMTLDVTFDAKRTGGTDCGQYLKVEKYAAGSDDANPRGHRLDLSIGGRIDGHGVHDSGLGQNIIGTSINYSDASWIGDRIAVVLRDGFRVTNCLGWNIVLNANALASLDIGAVDLDCGILIARSGQGGSPTRAASTAARIRVMEAARFAARDVLTGLIR